jgi:hypothetical protein
MDGVARGAAFQGPLCRDLQVRGAQCHEHLWASRSLPKEFELVIMVEV